ncbi:unnamed protein product [Bursaphelenchus xylophilus]|uniref:(pine wood nematode) hypothetical protein n=1 Tax=Bursaphelenchus xylophilus TaxID=6326 RepID=A0A1I7RT20_BURXY|nr:unnamed protein product [Bursaphelenchus xylophilus]CAG9122670.1 unnamed protein product [Bursaphelenchus xylophilus]
MGEIVDLSAKLDKVLDLAPPSLDELKAVIENGLHDYFVESSVTITDCPDFKTEPYNLEGSGLSPDLRIVDCGGHGNFFPKFQRHKQFDLKKISKTSELPQGWIFGPGAAPRETVGVNAELVANANFNTNKVNCYNGRLTPDGKGYLEGTHSDTCFKMIANLALCSDEAGHRVLRISAKKRTGDGSFTEIIQKILASHYRNKLVCLAGIWRFEKGRGYFHIVPDYPEKDFEKLDDIWKNWLHFFELPAPMTMTTVIHSNDIGLDVPVEHTHGFSGRGHCGHYHGDVTPSEAVYDGYFLPATKLYRIDNTKHLS